MVEEQRKVLIVSLQIENTFVDTKLHILTSIFALSHVNFLYKHDALSRFLIDPAILPL